MTLINADVLRGGKIGQDSQLRGAYAGSVLAMAFYPWRTFESVALANKCTLLLQARQRKFVSAECRNQHVASVRSPDSQGRARASAGVLRIECAPLGCASMNSAAAIDSNVTMRALLEHFPGAQRALFRRYHVGGCSSCGFAPEETLAGVCARNENLDIDEVVEHIVASDAADRAMQIEPAELSQRRGAGELVHLLDVRTREEFDAVKIEGAQLFTQELMQEILGNWPREELLVVYDHDGTRSMDAAAYFQGHEFENVKSLRGGIDAWSAEVDSTLPRYHLERT